MGVRPHAHSDPGIFGLSWDLHLHPTEGQVKAKYSGVLIQVASDRKANHEEAVYSLRALEDHSCDQLHQWLLDQHIPRPIIKEKLHCSIVCACNYLPPEYIPDRRHLSIGPDTYILGTIGPAFALFFQCGELEQQWRFAVEHGVDMVYHRFVPHISLSYTMEPGWNYENVQPPQFTLAFREEIVSNFDTQFAKRNWANS